MSLKIDTRLSYWPSLLFPKDVSIIPNLKKTRKRDFESLFIKYTSCDLLIIGLILLYLNKFHCVAKTIKLKYVANREF